MYAIVLMTALSTGTQTPAYWCNCQPPVIYSSCHGCSGCHGCYGCSGCHGCSGCFGCSGCSSYVVPFSCSGCHGCHGYSGSIGVMEYTPAIVPVQPLVPSVPSVPTMPPPAEKLPEPKPMPPATQGSTAKLIIEVPPTARVYIDDQLMQTTDAQRTFQTPTLETGETYYYELRVEMEQNGTRSRAEKRVVIRAGDEIRVSFTDLGRTITATSKR